jgi:hypothetical protein
MAFDSSDRNAGLCGDLGVTQIAVESQSDHLLLFVGQPVELVADHHPVDDPIN